MATAQQWADLEQLYITTAPYFVPGVLQQQFREDNVFLSLLLERKRLTVEQQAGHGVVARLAIGINPNGAWRSPRAVIPTQESDMLTQAYWPWGTYTGAITVYEHELQMASGKEQLVDILDQKLLQATETLKQDIERAVLQSCSAGVAEETRSGVTRTHDPSYRTLGLIDAVGASVAVNGSTDSGFGPKEYGSLSRVTYTQWEANVVNSEGLASLGNNLDLLVDSCSYGSREPDLLLTDVTGVELLRDIMGDNVRYTSMDVGDASFKGVEFRGRPVIADRLVAPATTSIFAGGTYPSTWYGTADTANTHRYYALRADTWRVYTGRDWGITSPLDEGWRQTPNQLSRVRLLRVIMQVVCLKPYLNGVLRNVPES